MSLNKQTMIFLKYLSKDFNDHLSLIDTLNFDHKKIMNPEIILFGRYVCCCCCLFRRTAVEKKYRKDKISISWVKVETTKKQKITNINRGKNKKAT